MSNVAQTSLLVVELGVLEVLDQTQSADQRLRSICRCHLNLLAAYAVGRHNLPTRQVEDRISLAISAAPV